MKKKKKVWDVDIKFIEKEKRKKKEISIILLTVDLIW
jgi:hypothetical protein